MTRVLNYFSVSAVSPPKVQSVVVDDGTAQRSLFRSLTVTFSAAVSFTGSPAAAFQLTRTSTGGGSVGLIAGTPTLDQGHTVVTLTWQAGALVENDFHGTPFSLADGRYQLTVLANQVIGPASLALDGDGNGTAGDNYLSPPDTVGGGPGQLHLFRLFGDVNGDGFVAAQDFNAFRATFGSDLNDPDNTVPYVAAFDFNGDGFVAAQDFNAFKTRYGLDVFDL
jgi:hypothetical protein